MNELGSKTLLSSKKQFAHIDAPFLNWDFELRDDTNSPMGASINKDFRGLAKEVRIVDIVSFIL